MRVHPSRWGVAALLFILGACAQMPEPAPLIGPPAARPAVVKKLVPSMGHYKVGAPYRIRGVLYVPAVDYQYDETGEASWYGSQFHGRATANGETYDQNDLTAAHPTLPLPSMVRVTNLDNGRAITLRVNDRGPFAHGRILDVSRKAAQMLGFQRKGIARVRVKVLEQESRDLARRYGIEHGDEVQSSLTTRKPTS